MEKAYVEVESFCRVMKKPVLLSGFLKYVTNAASLLRVTPEIPELDSPTQSVLRNSGEDRRNSPWRLSSSYFSESIRFSCMGEP